MWPVPPRCKKPHSEKRTSRDLGFEYLDSRATVEYFRNCGKGPALKHLAGELYAGGGGCTLSIGQKAKMEIPAQSAKSGGLVLTNCAAQGYQC